jgi:DNA-binding transcriptional MerR regulator
MENTIGSGEAARRLGVTVKTLQRWERESRLTPLARTASNRRRYSEEQLLDKDGHAAGAPHQD